MDIETKACKQCGAVKPLTEFYLNRRGHTSRCCECVREGVRLNDQVQPCREAASAATRC